MYRFIYDQLLWWDSPEITLHNLEMSKQKIRSAIIDLSAVTYWGQSD